MLFKNYSYKRKYCIHDCGQLTKFLKVHKFCVVKNNVNNNVSKIVLDS